MQKSMDMRSLTMLDRSGDTTIVWDEQTDEKMLAIIEARMAQGYRFFILKPRALPMLPPRKTLAKSIKDVRDAGSVVILDEDIHTLFLSGDIATMKAQDDLGDLVKSSNASEIVKSQSVAVKPAKGG